MAKSQVQFTKDNEYYTPKEFVARIKGTFGWDIYVAPSFLLISKGLYE